MSENTNNSFFGQSDVGVGPNIFCREYAGFLVEKYSLGLSPDFRRVDNGIIYTSDKDYPDKKHREKFSKIVFPLLDSIETDGYSSEDIVACYKEKRRNRIMIIFDSEQGYISRTYLDKDNNICVSEDYCSLMKELKGASKNPLTYGR